MRLYFLIFAASLMGFIAPSSHAEMPIRITGSSSVFPFSTAVAEEFGRISPHRTPIVEAIGTGGGMRLFCSGYGPNTPDIVNASRPIKASEYNECQQNGVHDIIEIKFGLDGIILANTQKAPHFRLTLQQIYLAIAAQVPAPKSIGGEGLMIKNPYKNWRQIDPALPDQPILIIGPPPSSGTRDSFSEIAMMEGCANFTGLLQLKQEDPALHRFYCQAIRDDGHYIEGGENDNLIVQKLQKTPDALGIFAFSFLTANSDILQASAIASPQAKSTQSHDSAQNPAAQDDDGYILPDYDTIASKHYPIHRYLYLYIKKNHALAKPALVGFLREFTSDKAIGEFGYLTERGLVALPQKEKEYYQNIASMLQAMPRF